MKKLILAALATLGMCSEPKAQVPNFPQTLPPNTVVGRLGTGPGPSQAIPFDVLAAQLGSGGGGGGGGVADPRNQFVPPTLIINSEAPTTTPQPIPEWSPLIRATGNLTNTAIVVDGFGSGPIVGGRRAEGTQAAPTPIIATKFMLALSGRGYDGSSFAPGPFIGLIANETWTPSAHGSYISFFTIPNGSTGAPELMRLNGSGGLSLGTSISDPGAFNLAITGSGLSDTNAPAISTIKTRSGGAASQLNDNLGQWWFYGTTAAGAGLPGVHMFAIQESGNGATFTPARWQVNTSSVTAQSANSMKFDSQGHLAFGAEGPPTLAAPCNGAGSLVVTGSTDVAGSITTPTAASTTCTINWFRAFSNLPFCTVSGNIEQPLTLQRTLGTLTITYASSTSVNFHYVCIGS